MPVKWKIFFAFNIIVSLPALAAFFLLIIQIINSHSPEAFTIIPLLVLFGLGMVTFNGFLNIYVLQRYFPDKLVPENIKGFNVFSLIVNIIASLGMLILCVFGAMEEFGPDNYERDGTGKAALSILIILTLMHIYIIVLQIQLPGLISRNNKNKINSMIDSIGQ